MAETGERTAVIALGGDRSEATAAWIDGKETWGREQEWYY
jgi:hypothetical protein